jgi:hypothetical protein
MLGAVEVLARVAFASGFESTRTESTVISHGHRYNAVIVIVVSRQFENVLVEQNHCHGLAMAMRSWHIILANMSQYKMLYSQLPKQYYFPTHTYSLPFSTCNNLPMQRTRLAQCLATW